MKRSMADAGTFSLLRGMVYWGRQKLDFIDLIIADSVIYNVFWHYFVHNIKFLFTE